MRACWWCTLIGVLQRVVWAWRVVWGSVLLLSEQPFTYAWKGALWLGVGSLGLWALQQLSACVSWYLDGGRLYGRGWDWHLPWLWRGFIFLVVFLIGLNVLAVGLVGLSGQRRWAGKAWECRCCGAIVFHGWRISGRLRVPWGGAWKLASGEGFIPEALKWAIFSRRLRCYLYVRALLHVDAELFYYCGLGGRRAGMDLAYGWLKSPKALLGVLERQLGWRWFGIDWQQDIETGWNRWWRGVLSDVCAGLSLNDELRLVFLERVVRAGGYKKAAASRVRR